MKRATRWFLAGLLLTGAAAADGAGRSDPWSERWSGLWQRPDQAAAVQLERGDAQGAAERFHDPAWRGAARYRSGDFAGALEALAGLSGPEIDYNRGNALARLGRLDAAAAAYEAALAQQPALEDARHNLELVRRLLEERQSQDAADAASQSSADRQNQGGADGKDSGDRSREPEPPSGSGSADTADPASQTGDRQQEEGTPPDAAGADQRDTDTNANTNTNANEPSASLPADRTRDESERERQQALETQLRRVPDDPAGLLRQRFLLQHLHGIEPKGTR